MFKKLYIFLTLFFIFISFQNFDFNAQTKINTKIKAITDRKMLVHKHFSNPILDVNTNAEPKWRSKHVANASILSPSETKDGYWKMYVRGSGLKNGVMHDQIGLFKQHRKHFDPFGPWLPDNHNPILKNGSKGSYDEKHLLDTVAIKGKRDNIYVFYKSRNMKNKMSYSGAVSKNHGDSFKKFANNPISFSGASDVVYKDGKYYHFLGSYNSKKKTLQVRLSRSKTPTSEGKNLGVVLSVGSKGSYDQRSVFGTKVFKLPRSRRWFMVYQLSASHVDYPERIHVAYSNDLVHWEKVKNKLPFMLRGKAGAWDQGGVWTSDVFVYQGVLYFYYEGWGSYKNDFSKRDKAYYRGGNSRLGVASVSVKSFLKWVKGDSEPAHPIFKLINHNSHNALDVAGQMDYNGANLHQWSYWGGNNQKFEFIKSTNGSYKIKPLHSYRCLDVSGGSFVSRANVHLWKCHNGDNQKWYVRKTDKNTYNIINKNTWMVLETANYKKAANVRQNYYMNRSNQEWNLIQLNE